MCQLCQIATISRRDRWPTRLEPTLFILRETLLRAHADAEAFNSRTNNTNQPAVTSSSSTPSSYTTSSSTTSSSTTSSPTTTPSTPTADQPTPTTDQLRTTLFTTISTIHTTLSLLESERDEWWWDKLAQRLDWAAAGEGERIARLQAVNNKMKAMIEDMRARVGLFGRWGLGMEGGER